LKQADFIGPQFQRRWTCRSFEYD